MIKTYRLKLEEVEYRNAGQWTHLVESLEFSETSDLKQLIKWMIKAVWKKCFGCTPTTIRLVVKQ